MGKPTIADLRGRVRGQVITKDDVRNRFAIESFRLDYISSRIQTLVAQGRLSQADAQQQQQFISQRRDQLASLTVQRLVDNALMGKLAADDGIAVADADIDKQLTDEATTAEQRHTWMIEIDPVADPVTGEVGDAQKQESLVRAEKALSRLNRGESWEDVAKGTSDSALAPQAVGQELRVAIWEDDHDASLVGRSPTEAGNAIVSRLRDTIA